MKFKFLGVEWNFWPIACMLWVLIGCTLIGGTFAIPEMSPMVCIAYFTCLIIYAATGNSLSKLFMKNT